MKMKYNGCSDNQARVGGCLDPRKYLIVGEIYEVVRRVVHNWHTQYYLKGFEIPFNSVCFTEC